MKKIVTNIIAIPFVLFILISCSQNDNHTKEIELKEKEIALKQKELDLKEKQLSVDSANKVNSKKNTDLKSDIKSHNEDNHSKSKLIINTQSIAGTIGQVTFQLKGKTLFYFETKPKRGKIIINDTEYDLSKLSFDSKKGSYKISGNQVVIKTSNCKYDNSRGGDCAYGTFPSVTITLNGVLTSIKNVELQDCPEMDF